jgi:predicted ester cyclase
VNTTTVRTVPELFFGGQDQLKGALPTELCAAEYRAHIAGFPVMDAAGHSAFGRAFYDGFPDIYHTIDEVHATDDGFATRFTLRGTHTAPFMGIPATNRGIEVSAIVLMSVSNGKVTSLRAIFDQLGLMRQLGVIPG